MAGFIDNGNGLPPLPDPRSIGKKNRTHSSRNTNMMPRRRTNANNTNRVQNGSNSNNPNSTNARSRRNPEITRNVQSPQNFAPKKNASPSSKETIKKTRKTQKRAQSKNVQKDTPALTSSVDTSVNSNIAKNDDKNTIKSTHKKSNSHKKDRGYSRGKHKQDLVDKPYSSLVTPTEKPRNDESLDDKKVVIEDHKTGVITDISEIRNPQASPVVKPIVNTNEEIKQEPADFVVKNISNNDKIEDKDKQQEEEFKTLVESNNIEEDISVDSSKDLKQKTGTNAPTMVPTPSVNLDKKKKKIFKRFATTWLILIVVVGSVISSWGYSTWIKIETSKLTDQAYQEGVSNASSTPTIPSTLRISEDDLSKIIVSAPGATFPTNPVLTRYTLDGWSTPGGNETHGRVKVSMCYTGDGVTSPKKSSAYLVSDNANAEVPAWSVDSISVTGDNCTIGDQK